MRVRYAETRTLSGFHRSDDFIRCCIGPVGSGKSTACVMEIFLRAAGQAPGPDQVRRTRFAVIRNTYSQLRDTTRKTFEQWIPSELGKWHEQSATFTMEYAIKDGTTVHSEVIFRALDRPEDIKKLLSLELTGAYVNEAREIPKHVLDVLETRVGRYPSKAQGGASWFGIWMDTNPWHPGHWAAKLFAQGLPEHRVFRQPGGRNANAENRANLPDGYYERLCHGKDREWIAMYVDGQDGDAAPGSVYGRLIEDLRRRGGVADFSHANDGVYTTWDLGYSDSTAIWFWRINEHRSVDLIDHYEAHGLEMRRYFEEVERRGYKYVQHYLPHDARAKNLETGRSIVEMTLDRWPDKVEIVPANDPEDGIASGRWLLEQPMRVHSRCAAALETLAAYRYEWDEESQTFGVRPVHDFASHTADAFRYLACVLQLTELLSRKPPEKPAMDPRQPTMGTMTLDDLWKMRERDMRRRG